MAGSTSSESPLFSLVCDLVTQGSTAQHSGASIPASDYPPLSSYAIIGDCRSAALISRDGSIDWLCLPRFDSPSFFNRLLDWRRGGHWSIIPQCSYSSRRWYGDTSAVLVTEFQTERGSFRLTDAMPVSSETEKRTRLSPFRSLIRRLEGLEGKVPVQVVFKPRPDNGRLVPAFHRRGRYGYFADLGNRLIHLATELELEVEEGEVSGCVEISAGQSVALWMSYSEDAPAVYPSLLDASPAIQRTSAYWSEWARQCTYDGPYVKNVVRSALTLKLLTYAPSGAIVAAPTTSLPEVVGGVRNWDYRYCWLRDASLTAQLFFRLGYTSEPIAFVRWLLHATALTYPALQVLYDVHGEAKLPERSLPFLEGYRKSAPVRVGNRAHDQVQLDVYGEVIGALHAYVGAGNELDSEMRRRVVRIANLVASRWTTPDHGMWEIPTARQHYLHSKVMCWVALAGAERLMQRLENRADVSRWAAARERIRQLVDTAGYSAEVQSFVRRSVEKRRMPLPSHFPCWASWMPLIRALGPRSSTSAARSGSTGCCGGIARTMGSPETKARFWPAASGSWKRYQ